MQWALFRRTLDIVRVLLDRGADCAHVSALGLTPLFYLLAVDGKEMLDKKCKTTDFLQILKANELVFLDLEAHDPQGLSVLDHVVCRGTGDEVKALLTLGAQLIPETTEAGKSYYSKSDEDVDPWQLPGSAMSQAIWRGNHSTFSALLEAVPHDRINSRYDGEWTMLHYAAYLGHSNMVKCLLEAGADGFYVGLDDLEREGLKTCDAEDWQLTLTYDTYKRYLGVLQACGKVAIRTADDKNDDIQDVFWDADETWN